MGSILLLIFEIITASAVLYLCYKAWVGLEIQEKLDKAEQIEQDFKTVRVFEKNYKDLSDKNKKINQFKKQDF